MIRPATEADIPALVEMGRRFHPQSPYAAVTTFDPDRLTQTLAAWLQRPDVAIFIAPDGFLILNLVQFHFCPELVAVEISFHAKGSGDALRRAGEGWAISKGAACALGDSMAGKRQGRVNNWYARNGYLPLGHMYMKAL
jgi:hypothetical protein